MFKNHMRRFTTMSLSIATASLFFSCSDASTEREVNDNGITSVEKANYRNAALPIAMNSWMSGLQDNISISRISIPGTHDSGATREIPSNSGTAKTQNLSIGEQLNTGVRFLDIRCRHIDNSFAIHHGPIYQNLNFDDVLTACYSFLESHPSETIIMSVKEEYDASNTTRSFESTFDSYIQKNPSKWDLGTNIPNLGQVRGKIKLLRRFSAGTAKGINATSWADNTTFEINNNGAPMKVQDYYKVTNNDDKWAGISSLLNEAKNDGSNKLFVNFTSGYKPGIFGIPSIPTVSNSINPKLKTFFQTNTQGTYGVMPIDFVNAELSELIVKTNF
ncbi:phosphatidylinositol-specific phospholipase C [Chryseobacterium sp. WG14]|uniref:phosphatidylinositol-specific phospholipase C n=1 Tax=unclassified Chryseobacterium TaxID=2593645 RepID=UPI001DA6FCD8|nr:MULTISPECIES: phosphatidylinositol-specific phospholipase C [unclassified Chryseobacterium]MCQ9635006.1 phosphatidylinositol-specific phospholipase C [Chryseobacterium sp. WG23]MCQ9642070.1 phosphatidylinositol-specific phospholipase C [Chryseobacterium sp. WG14]CAH0223242.1 1-phosphatidylinositol phosphodiesterase [Chryseobacterium sp. Bi04]